MPRIAFVVTYLAGVAVAVVLVNANIGEGVLAVAIWGVASVLLGWGTGQYRFALLAFLAIPLAIPFDIPNNYAYSEPLPIWLWAAYLAFASACLVVLAVLVRLIVEDRRQRRVPS